ncbi:MAG: hypothetical protein JKY20_03545, partial [Alphaproteobacteria bacterium]|nr:hypothetical protein [Alphaproteobacteria bacterium]
VPANISAVITKIKFIRIGRTLMSLKTVTHPGRDAHGTWDRAAPRCKLELAGLY